MLIPMDIKDEPLIDNLGNQSVINKTNQLHNYNYIINSFIF